VRGAGVERRVTTDRSGVARLTVAPSRVGLVFFGGSPRTRRTGIPCRTLLGVLPARSTIVTG
jgi:hypothetical protein